MGTALHGVALVARTRAADEHQVLLGQELDDREPLLGHALAAHLAGAANALEHARRRGRRTDRGRRTLVVRAVRLRAGGKVVALDGALEALALPAAGDLDLLAD